MIPDLTSYRSAGWYLTRAFPRTAFSDRELLPPALVSMSECLAAFAPGQWAIEWTIATLADREVDAAAFGVAAEGLPRVISWSTTAFDVAFGWPSCFYSLDAAKGFAADFLAGATGLRLVGLGLHEKHVASFVEESQPREPREGAPGIATQLAREQPLAPGGELLGWEPLGWDHGFHSWLCNGLEREVARERGIRPGAWGLLESAEAAEEVAAFAGREETHAEPGLWLPWVLVEYPLDGAAPHVAPRRPGA
jgi:hypothetical protein